MLPKYLKPKQILVIVTLLSLLASLDLVSAQETKPIKVGFTKTFIEVNEGDVIEIVVELDATSDKNVSLDYSLEDYEARAERDYLDLSGGTLSIPAGETKALISIDIIDNTKLEEEESFRIFLSNPLTDTIELSFRKALTVLILDNDISSESVLEDFEANKDTSDLISSLSSDLSSDLISNLAILEIAADSPLALPQQEEFENVLAISTSDSKQVFRKNFLSRQNWQNSSGMSLWYYGDNAEDITATFSAVDVNKLKQSQSSDWTIVWQDEFNSAKGTLPNENYWTIELGDGAGWGNSEHQYYTSKTENIFHDGQGNLVIRAEKLPEDSNLDCYYGPCKYTSARIKTEDKVEVEYGRIEARMKIPSGQGFWPAFWMLGNNFKSVNWPNSGEIDIMENIGREPLKIHGTVHGPGYSGGNGPSSTAFLPKREAFADDFHSYAVEWEQDEIRWYLDGTQYHTLRPEDLAAEKRWVFDHPFFILLNLAVGGSWPGYPNESSEFPQDFLIDYVRVYELPELSSSFPLSPTITTSQTGKWQKISFNFKDSIPERSLEEVWNYSISFPPSATKQYIDRIELITK